MIGHELKVFHSYEDQVEYHKQEALVINWPPARDKMYFRGEVYWVPMGSKKRGCEVKMRIKV